MRMGIEECMSYKMYLKKSENYFTLLIQEYIALYYVKKHEYSHEIFLFNFNSLRNLR